jgi:hypothetical protein
VGRFLVPLAFWPDKEPFLAITGMAGRQTAGKAVKAGFRPPNRDLKQIVAGIVAEVRKQPHIGALIVLSHMDRDEDKELQQLLSDHGDDHGYIYLLGGHDHTISWRERDRRNCYLSKCKSNCKSITLFLLPKDGITAPRSRVVASLKKRFSREQEIAVMQQTRVDPAKLWRLFEFLDRTPDAEIPPELLRDEYPAASSPREELLAELLASYRSTAGSAVRPDFREAFERRIVHVFERVRARRRSTKWFSSANLPVT